MEVDLLNPLKFSSSTSSLPSVGENADDATAAETSGNLDCMRDLTRFMYRFSIISLSFLRVSCISTSPSYDHIALLKELHTVGVG